MAEPMNDERLAEIKAAAEQYRGSLTIRNKPNGAIAHRAELLAEVERLRAVLKADADIWEDNLSQIHADRDHWQNEAAAMFEQRDHARAEAAKLRAQLEAIGKVREEWGYGYAPDRITTPLEIGYRNGTPEQRVRAAARHLRTKVWKRLAGD